MKDPKVQLTTDGKGWILTAIALSGDRIVVFGPTPNIQHCITRMHDMKRG
jgi:hypothetical protein